jgi:hypothetical protein
VGGGWVGAPTLSTVFPAIMEVDYVRVYQTLDDIGISGKDFVKSAAQGVTYMLPQIAGASYAWSVPSTAQITSGQGTPAITVNWGNSGGDVSALATSGFEKGVKYWKGAMSPVANGNFALDSLAAAHSGHSVRTIVNVKPANPWDVQISQQGFSLESAKQYEGRLWAKAAVSGAQLNAGVINAQTYAYYGGTTCTLTDSWKEYTFRFTASQNALGSFNLDLGTQPATYYCDDMVLVRLDGQTGIGIDSRAAVPLQNSLDQNFPNPFNPLTIIKYTVAGNRGWGLAVSDVSLVVYDLLGRQVAVLVNERKLPGRYEVTFDGSRLSSGVYFYRLRAGNFVETKQMLVVK